MEVRPASPARALGFALLQALHVGIFRELRLGRAHRQPGLLVAVEEQVISTSRAKVPVSLRNFSAE